MLHLAVSSGMDVKRETASKDIMISSGSSLRSLKLVLSMSGDFLNKGWRIIARYLDNSYVGDLGKETIGLRGIFSFCILGRP